MKQSRSITQVQKVSRAARVAALIFGRVAATTVTTWLAANTVWTKTIAPYAGSSHGVMLAFVLIVFGWTLVNTFAGSQPKHAATALTRAVHTARKEKALSAKRSRGVQCKKKKSKR